VPHFAGLCAWPTPREILRAGKRYLKEVCRLGYRVEQVLSFCREVCDGRFDPESLIHLAASPAVSSDEILSRLRSIRGIGPSSAHYLLSLLGRNDRLVIDSSTVAHVARTHTNGKKPAAGQIEKLYAGYGRWKNLVWWYEYWLTWETARSILREARRDRRRKRR
jgi:3-methyladenine DNA glycosylase/8-oxoguanine DNA glycosylase